MENQFWHTRWRNNEIGFHEPVVHPLLERHWERVRVGAHSRVFVPLCGKSLDMVALCEHGHDVIGIELSPKAVEAFIAEQNVPARQDTVGHFDRHRAPGYTLLVGDFFMLDRHALGAVDAVYDRASLIALPPQMRQRYADALRNLLDPGVQILLITLQYDVVGFEGPPFSVSNSEVQALFGDWCAIKHLETAPAEVKGHGVAETALLMTVT